MGQDKRPLVSASATRFNSSQTEVPGFDPWLSLALGVALFVVYALGACRTIYVGDSGELTAAVGILGIPHPTGYPLYVILGHLWSLLVPIGSIAFRTSLFSCFCAAAACSLLFAFGRRFGLHRLAALVSALLLAFAPSFWAEANIQRVYALNALFVVATTGLGILWYRERRSSLLFWAFFLSGLGACNHTYMAIHGIALGLFVLATDWSIVTRPIEGAKIVASAFVGLLPYAYLPLRSRMNPRLDWGNPETWDGFLGVVGRRDFWDRAWLEKPSDFLIIGADYGYSLGWETLWAGAALALVGLWAVGRKKGPVLFPLLAMAGNFAAMALHGSRSDIFIWHRYYIPSYAMIALMAGWGCHVLQPFLRGSMRWLLLAVPLLMFTRSYKECDRSQYRIAEDFAVRVLKSLPPGAHLSATDDNILFVLIYLHLVEKMRPDIDLILQGVGGADLPNLRFDPREDPLFFTHHPNWDIPALRLVPVGTLFRVWRAEDPPPKPVLDAPFLAGETSPDVPKDYLTQNLIGHFHFMRGQTFEDLGQMAEARKEYDLAIQASPNNDVLFYNLGLIYRRLGLLEESIAMFRRSEEINPRHIASNSRPRASDRVRELESERHLAVPTAGPR